VLRLLFSHDIFAALFWAAAADGGRGSAGQFGLFSINCAAILGEFCLVFLDTFCVAVAQTAADFVIVIVIGQLSIGDRQAGRCRARQKAGCYGTKCQNSNLICLF